MKRAYITPQLASLGSLREVTANGGRHGSSTKHGKKWDGHGFAQKKKKSHGRPGHGGNEH